MTSSMSAADSANRKPLSRPMTRSATSSGKASTSDVDGQMTNGSSYRQITSPMSSPSHRGRTAAAGLQTRTAPCTPVHVHYNTFRAPFFATVRSPKRDYFIIHPEWASERIVPASWIPPTSSTTAVNDSVVSADAAPPSSSTATVPRGVALPLPPQPPSSWTSTYPLPNTGRRCRSAPPRVRSRNPITWENWGI